MIEILKRGYFPLKQESINSDIPARPGMVILAVQLANGVHEPFYTSETKNIRNHLLMLTTTPTASFAQTLAEYLHTYRCYFAYYIINHGAMTEDIEKLLAETADPGFG